MDNIIFVQWFTILLKESYLFKILLTHFMIKIKIKDKDV